MAFCILSMHLLFLLGPSCLSFSLTPKHFPPPNAPLQATPPIPPTRFVHPQAPAAMEGPQSVIASLVPASTTVCAPGDVVVTGPLQGTVHAGCLGDATATVVALAPAGGTVRIAGSRPVRLPRGRAVKATLQGGGVQITSYQLHRPVLFPSELWEAANQPARGSLLTGLYIGAVGLCATFAPRATFGLLFAIDALASGWIRVLGVLATLFGGYYVGAALGDVTGRGARGFYWATVVGRVFLAACFAWMVVTGRLAERGLLVLAALNLASGLGMCWALRRSRVSQCVAETPALMAA
eukprot:EG_transcript_14748